jgi:hypothetical protein
VTSKPKSINHSPAKEDPSKKASIWIALGDSTYRRLWLAMVISGSCIAAQNTAIYWALNALGATTVVISLMATVSALPATLFTLPAGAIADMVDRKKILLAVQLWHAFIAVGLAILWLAHLLNPYIILTSGFLFSAGFAFSSPASSAAIAEMVSAEELGSAYTLAGAADGCFRHYRAVSRRPINTVNRSEQYLWRKRRRISAYVPSDCAVEASTGTIEPTLGEPFRVVDDCDPLCAVHCRNQDPSGPACSLLILYQYYPGIDAGGGPEGIAP